MGCSTSHPKSPPKNQSLGDCLTEKQMKLVRETWKGVDDDLEGTGKMVFKRLFELEKGFMKLFLRSGSMGDIKQKDIEMSEERLGRHVTIVMQALGAAVASLDDSRYLTSVLQNLGEMHTNYRVTGDMLPKLWPAIDHALKTKLGDTYSTEARESWRVVFFFFICKMREGMEAASKVSS
uniref:Globin Sp_gb n=1 Tax=Platynereis dumerilii TaxID=6359 RepID=A0A7T8CM12_PLADU|nr:globin Sp_gb [Platynereis dumerilii]